MTPDMYLKYKELGIDLSSLGYSEPIPGDYQEFAGEDIVKPTSPWEGVQIFSPPDFSWLPWERLKEELARANPLAYLYVKSAEIGYKAGTAAVPIVKAVQKAAKALGIDDPVDFLNLVWYGLIGIILFFVFLKLYPSVMIIKHVYGKGKK